MTRHAWFPTPESLLHAMRYGAKWRPVRWHESSLLRDGYCHLTYHGHMFVEHTPRTIGYETSPAIVGAQEAIRNYGMQWERVA